MSQSKIALYVLRALARYHMKGRAANLDALVEEIGIRRADLRNTVSALHREGYVDALRMQLTMTGFALGMSLTGLQMSPLRERKSPSAAA